MKTSKPGICIVGGGNVAWHLAYRFLMSGKVEVCGVWNRHPGKWKDFPLEVKVFSRPEDLPACDVVIIAVKDDAIGEVSRYFASGDTLVVHTSGSMPSTVISAPRKGVFYPLQSLHKDKLDIDFKNLVPILIYARSPEDMELLRFLGQAIAGSVYETDDRKRAALHVAAVFANNFSRFMTRLAYEIMQSEKMDFQILIPLIQQTFSEITPEDPMKKMTGPAIRNDSKTIERHLQYLQEKHPEEWADLYGKITRMIRERIKKRDS